MSFEIASVNLPDFDIQLFENRLRAGLSMQSGAEPDCSGMKCRLQDCPTNDCTLLNCATLYCGRNHCTGQVCGQQNCETENCVGQDCPTNYCECNALCACNVETCSCNNTHGITGQ